MAPAAKRRKTGQLEEIVFDLAARQDYLTGFHKRKEARKKHAQETAAKIEKEERVQARKQLRDQRKVDLETHIAEFNAELKKQNPDMINAEESGEDDGDAGEWGGISDAAEAVRDEDEYVDEDKYTTVTVEPMGGESEDETASRKDVVPAKENDDAKSKGTTKTRPWDKNKTADGKKPRKKKFRYETKAERQVTRQKQKNSSRAAKARRKGDKEKEK